MEREREREMGGFTFELSFMQDNVKVKTHTNLLASASPTWV